MIIGNHRSIVRQERAMLKSLPMAATPTGEDPVRYFGRYMPIFSVAHQVSDIVKAAKVANVPVLDMRKLGDLQQSIIGINTELKPQLSVKVPRFNNNIDRLNKVLSSGVFKQYHKVLNSQTATEEISKKLKNLGPQFQVNLQNVDVVDGKSKKIIGRKSQIVIEDKSVKDKIIPLDEAVVVLSVLDILRNINEQEVLNFYHYLSRLPLLGLKHPVGQKILEALQSGRSNDLTGVTMYHARKRPSDQQRPLTMQEMRTAPFGISGQGRFNVSGHGYFYTCDSYDGCVAENRASDGEVVDIAELRLNSSVKVLNLTDENCPIISYCGFESTGLTLEPAYLVPNYIAQCCKSVGIHAICYKSVRHPGSLNYVFWDYVESWFEHVNFQVHNVINNEEA